MKEKAEKEEAIAAKKAAEKLEAKRKAEEEKAAKRAEANKKKGFTDRQPRRQRRQPKPPHPGSRLALVGTQWVPRVRSESGEYSPSPWKFPVPRSE